MTASPNRRRRTRGAGARSVLLLSGLLWAAAGAAAAQVGPPVKLLPTISDPAPAQAAEPAPSTPGPAQTQAGETVEVEMLSAVDPSSVGLLDESNGGFGLDMWQGSRRAMVEQLLPRLPVGTPSRSMQRLARRLLLSTARVPAGEPTVPSLLGLRLERIAAGGDTEAADELLRLAPAHVNDPAFARARVHALLLAGDHAGACAEFQTLVAEDPSETYWLKGLTFCKALSGDQGAAQFGVELLHDLGADSDTAFFSLIDALGGGEATGPTSLLDPDPLHLAMLQASRTAIPDDAVAGAPPAILRAIARAPNAALEVRLTAAEQSEAVGGLAADALAEIYKSVIFSPEDVAASLTVARDEPGPLGNALLYQAGKIQRDPTLRAQALQLAWRLGRERGGFGTAARVNRDTALAIEPAAGLAWFAGDAVRALLGAGEVKAASRWFDLARENASPDDAQAAATVLDAWPLIFMADPAYRTAWDPGLVALWWTGLNEAGLQEEERQENAALVLTLLEALGYEIDAADWQRLYEAPTTVTAYVPSVSLWRDFRDAAAHGRVGETVLLALLVLGDGGPAGANVTILGEVIAALSAVGLETEARAMAVEAALARGV